MFQSSADQTQWFHLFRVQKVFPTTFILIACGDAEIEGAPAQVLDLRIFSRDQSMVGGSWCVKKEGENGKHITRLDITRFLELHAKHSIAIATKRGVDEIEMIDSSHEELALSILLDNNLRSNLEAMAPTLFSKFVRDQVKELNVRQTGFEFVELPDWTTRNEDLPSES